MKRYIAIMVCTILFWVGLPIDNLTGIAYATDGAAQGQSISQNQSEREGIPAGKGTVLQDGLWRYQLNENGWAIILGYDDASVTVLRIPDALGGHDVAGIGTRAFASNMSLRALTVHGNVQTIADDAFTGLNDLTLKGWNGSYVLSYAKARGIPCGNLSTLQFTDKAQDFSDVESAHYEYIDSSTLRLNALEAQRLSIGSIFYMPPDDRYSLGEAFEVTGISGEGQYRYVNVTKAAPEDAITKIVINEENMRVDYDNIVFYEGVSLGDMAQARGVIDATAKLNLPLQINYERNQEGTNKKLKVSGGVNIWITASARVDMDIYPFKINAVELKSKATAKLGVQINIDKEWEIPLAKVPLIGIGLANAFVNLKLVVNAGGTLELKTEISSEACVTLKNGELKPFLNNKWDHVELSGAFYISALLKPEVALEVPVIGKIVEFGPSIGLKGELRGETVSPEIDVIISLVDKVSVKIGLCESKDKTRKWYIGGTIREGTCEILTLKFTKPDESGQEVEPESGDGCVVNFNTSTGQKIDSQFVKRGGAITRPLDPTRIGYMFTGWYRDASCQTAWLFLSDTVSKNMTLYAGWQKDPAAIAPTNHTPAPDGSTESPTSTPTPAPTSSVTPDMEYENLKYRLDQNEAYIIITGYTGNPTNVEIPDSIDDLPVLTIMDSAFYKCDSLTSVVIPDSVTCIGERVFWECSNLKSVVLPQNMTVIPRWTFYRCEKLTDILIPDAVMCIDVGAFLYCETLERLSIPDGVEEIADDAFRCCYKLKSINIPRGIKNIAHGAFADCMSLEEIAIPNSVTSIETAAFLHCFNLNTITIPSGVTNIGGSAFGSCRRLKEVILPSGLKSIGGRAFGNCWEITSLTIPGEVTYMGDYAFVSCTNLKEVIISYGVKTIGEMAFRWNPSLTSVTIPSSVTTIGGWAFCQCDNLASINIPDSVTSIGNCAFGVCTSLTDVYIPDSVKSIGDWVFEDCVNLKSVHIPANLQHMGYCAFNGCTNLENVYIPYGITDIGERTFKDCKKLTSLTIPESVINIAEEACIGCSSLTEMILPESVSSIGIRSFANCTRLTTITIPGDITDIGEDAFANCPALKTVHCKKGGMIDSYFADNHPSIRRVYIDSEMLKVEYVNPRGETRTEYAYRGDKLSQPTDPVCNGYTFGGWYTDESCTTRWDFANNTMPDASLSLYAMWTSIPNYGYKANVDGGDASVTGYIGDESNLTVPESISGNKVTSLSRGAFGSNLRTVTLPESVTHVAPGAFEVASALSSITVAASNSNYMAIDGVLYSKDGRTLVAYPALRTGSAFAVPNGVVRIEESAFTGAQILQRITLPEGLTAIGAYAFRECSNLMDVTLPSTLETIGSNAFLQCAALESLTLPASVASIGASAFSGCADDFELFGPINNGTISSYAAANYIDYNKYPLLYYVDGELALQVTRTAGHKISDLYTPASDETRNFTGWSVTESGEPADFNGLIMPASELALYAVWQARQGDFETAPDTYGVQITRYLGDKTIIDVPIAIGGLPVTSIAEGAFADGVTLIGDADAFVSEYAAAHGLDFQARTYKLTFDSAGGASVAERAFPAGALTGAAPTPVRDNYALTCWITSSGDIWDFDNDVQPAHDMALTAVWSKLDESIMDCPFWHVENGDGTVTITGFAGGVWLAAIPETINGMTVTAIDDYAFSGDGILDELTIPITVKEIGAYAFAGSRVSSVTISDAVTDIGECAFMNCASLTDLTLGNGCTDLPANMLSDCTSLVNLTIPEGVETLGEACIANCTCLQSLTLPSSLKVIFERAFSGCAMLSRIALPTNVNVPANAFDGCDSLTDIVTIQASDSAYRDVSDLNGVLVAGSTIIRYPSGRTGEYTIPGTITAIGEGAFKGSALTKLTIPVGVTSIGKNAFRDSIALQAVAWESAIAAVPEGMFANCTSLKSMALPGSISSVGANAFSNCQNLESINIPSSVLTIADGALPQTDKLVIYGASGTYAETFADEHGIRFIQTGGIPVKSITVSRATLHVTLGETTVLSAELTPVNTSETQVEWSSDNELIATVNAAGNVMGLCPGTATITARAVNGATAKCVVTVGEANVLVTGITLNFDTMLLDKQYVGLLTAYVSPANATNKQLVWTSSDENVVAVDERGMLSAVSDGEAEIRAVAADGSGVSATCAIKVIDGYILGDVTDDGVVNMKDALIILQWIVNGRPLTSYDRNRSDCNGDGVVNNSDVIHILRTIVGVV